MTAPKIKLFEQRMVHRLILTESPAPARKVECTYFDGTRIHGKNSQMAHPPIHVSARDQDEVLWISREPFEIALKLAPDENPFYRTLPWQATKGGDDFWRVASGPLNPKLVPRQRNCEFSATRLIESTMTPDPDCEILDPHLIIEP